MQVMREVLSHRRVQGIEPKRDQVGVLQNPASPAQERPHRLLQLQGTLGNRRVQRLVESRQVAPRPTVKPPVPERGSEGPAASSRPAIEIPKVPQVEARKPDRSSRSRDGGGSRNTAAETAAEPETLESPAVSERAPAVPENDPSYQAVVAQLRTKAKREKTPAKTADQKQQETILASNLGPQESRKQDAYSNHLQKLEQVQPNELTVDQFMGQFKASTTAVAETLPKTKDEHGSVNGAARMGAARALAKLEVVQQTNSRSDPLRTEAGKNAADYQDEKSPPAKPPELEIDPVGRPAEIAQANSAAPKPKAPDEVSLDDKSRSLDEALLNHDINGQKIDIDERSLALPVSGEPAFDEAGETKRKAQDEIRKATPRYRGEERGVIGKSQAEMGSAVNTGLQLQHAAREKSFGEVLDRQQHHKASLEGKKRTVFSEIEATYNETKNSVQAELAKLQGIEDVFEAILNDAQNYFNKLVKQDLEYIYTPGVFDYSDWKGEHETEIKEEYERLKRLNGDRSGPIGVDPAYFEALRNVQDRSAAILFKNARTIFIGDVNRQVEEKIAKPVVAALNAARKHIRDGKEKANKAFATLDPKEQEEASNVLDAVTGRFEQLDESVEDRQREIVADMARSYNQGVGKLQATFDEIKKDVLTSWWEKAWNKLKAVVNAIIDFASRIVELLGRLAHLVGDIVSSPRAFFRNLVNGIGQGFSTFIGGIGEFLAKAFFDWLRGASGAAIDMPKDLGPQGIFSLFAQLLGLTTETVWERMEVVYDKTVANAFRRGEVWLERGLEIFRIVKEEGLAGLWDEIKSSLGNILEETLDMIKENVLYAAVKKVILEIGKMLVPGGGFIAIAEKVIRLLQFIAEARNKILDLIESFVDSVEMAVKGNVPGIINHITGALTKFITVALDFLVTLFGLGGLKDKVTRFIERMRQPVIRGIDWVLNKLKPVVMKGKKVLERGKEKAIGAAKAVVQVGVPQDPNERLKLAGRASVAAAKRLSGRLTKGLLTPILAGIRIRYGLTALEPYRKGNVWWVKATINPSDDFLLGEGGEEFDPGEFTEPSLWEDVAERVHAGELPRGEGTKLSEESFTFNLAVLEHLIDNYQKDLPYSRERQERKDAAYVSMRRYLEQAAQATNEVTIYARVRDAARVVNQLYSADVATMPGRQLQAHHRPGVAERTATFAKTRAFRRRVAIERRINDQVGNLKREEIAIAFTQPPTQGNPGVPRGDAERQALIRVYVEQQIDKEITDQARSKVVPLEEFHLDILTRDVHLGEVHSNR
jgi:uncharacterized protein YbgA (DUF1722 family)